MVMQVIVDLSKEVLILSMLVEVVDSMDDKEDHDFLETLLVFHPLLGVGFQFREAIKVSSSQP